ncbi:MAG: alpha/beta hydrolase [Treponema sp.]|jgi:acetyl esterase/lipase|nr:alpha/beta hydrolase [Treponema sp.]
MASEAMKQVKQMMGQHGSRSMRYALNPNADFTQIRRMMDAQSAQTPIEPGVAFEAVTIRGVGAERTIAGNAKGNGIIMYIHGGGFAFGSPASTRGSSSALAAETGLPVYSIDYRLAPEHRFPAGVEDCLAAYKALAEQFPQSGIAIIGESAGATFALVTALMAKDNGIKPPACVITYSPATDMAEDHPSRSMNENTDMIIPPDIMALVCGIYISSDDDPHNPYISPLYGDFTGCPPLKIVVDKSEVLYDDSRLLAEKASAAGVAVEYSEFDEAFHSFPATGKITPEGTQVLAETAAFIHKYCG